MTDSELRIAVKNRYTYMQSITPYDIISKLRILNKVLTELGLTLQEDIYPLQSKQFVHPQCSEAILQILEAHPLTNTESNATIDINDFVKSFFKTHDYHDRAELKRIAKQLQEEADIDTCLDTDPGIRYAKLCKVFAVDGFETSYDLEDYVDHLKYELREEPGFKLAYRETANLIQWHHVQGVRSLHEKKEPINPRKVRDIVLGALGFMKQGAEEEKRISPFIQSYLNFTEAYKDSLIDWIESKLAKESERRMEDETNTTLMAANTDEVDTKMNKE